MSKWNIMDFLEQINEGTRMPNRVPGDYFEQFSKKMLERVLWEEELKIIAPTLLDISRNPVYFVPEGYFKQFVVEPTQKVTVKVIKMPGWRKMVSYAAAAAMAGVLVTGAFLYTDNKSPDYFDMGAYNAINISAEINKLPEEAIHQYLNNNVIGGAGHELNNEQVEVTPVGTVENIADEELLNYVNESGEKPTS